MKLGIDFGTTRIIVAAVDRGNYPLVPFETAEATYEWFPPLVALRHGERLYGWDAWHAQADPSWTVIRSLKRYLEGAGPHTVMEAGGTRVRIVELLEGLLANLKKALQAHFGEKEPFQVMLGVPANANSNQRFLTVDGFRRAGFTVLGLLNEPSAASVEFGHRQKFTGRLLVYDLGGGTFDASLVDVDDKSHQVIATEGISTLGGDDFDRVLAEMALGAEKLANLPPDALFRLEEDCRRQKEALHPNSRRVVVDLDEAVPGEGQITINVSDFYERCRDLLDETVAATARLAAAHEIDALYVTGGGSELPLVARMLRDEFGRKVKRSEYTRSATAIGLAIQADSNTGYELREVFNRYFGVWRETDSGHRMVFDPIFPRGTQLPAAGEPPLTVSRRYHPVHNIGHFRYIEASHLGVDEQPAGDISIWDEILFPFDPAVRGQDLEKSPVAHTIEPGAEHVEECYQCDAAGVVTVTVRNLTSDYEQTYKLGRWKEAEAVVKPKATKRKRATA